MNEEFPPTLILTQPSGKALKQVNPKVAMQHWGVWFCQALEALAWLHAHGYHHGFIDSASLRIDETTNTFKLYLRPQGIVVGKEFNAGHTVYPPEILLKQAYEEGLSFSTAYDLLESKNLSLELCETQLDLDYSERVLQFVWKHMGILDPYKADVWMLGLTFLKQYLEFLTWPGVLTTTFYREDHDRFMECLACMLEAHPAKRISAEAAFYMWSPPLILYGESEEPDAESMLPPVEANVVLANSDPVETVAQTVVSAVPVSVCDGQPSVTAVPKPRRLVLSGYRDPAGRNKTRRNLRNSNLSLAIHNPVTHTQD